MDLSDPVRSPYIGHTKERSRCNEWFVENHYHGWIYIPTCLVTPPHLRANLPAFRCLAMKSQWNQNQGSIRLFTIKLYINPMIHPLDGSILGGWPFNTTSTNQQFWAPAAASAAAAAAARPAASADAEPVAKQRSAMTLPALVASETVPAGKNWKMSSGNLWLILMGLCFWRVHFKGSRDSWENQSWCLQLCLRGVNIFETDVVFGPLRSQHYWNGWHDVWHHHFAPLEKSHWMMGKCPPLLPGPLSDPLKHPTVGLPGEKWISWMSNIDLFLHSLGDFLIWGYP